MNKKINKIKKGMEFKNYRDICFFLNEKEKSSTSKKSQLKEWNRYFEWKIKGHKWLIIKKYDNPKNKKNKTIKHGLSNTRIYGIFGGMKERCYNKKSSLYENYGARGIMICEEWLDKENGFINFYHWAMNNGYEDSLSIDRIDVNGNYEPNNCRWVTMKIQARNKRTTIGIPNKNFMTKQELIDYLIFLEKELMDIGRDDIFNKYNKPIDK